MKLIIFLSIFMLAVFNYSHGDDLKKLSNCGIKVESVKLGKKQETFEISVEVNQNDLDLSECRILKTVAFSYHVQSSWTIVDTSSGKASFSIRRPTKYIEHLEMSFGFEQSPDIPNLSEVDEYYRIKVAELFE